MNNIIYRSRAPLRLGLGGGGTDVSPFSDKYGGAILNATISMYAYANLQPRDDNKIVFYAVDRNERFEIDSCEYLEIDGHLDLFKGIYNRIVKDYVKKPLSFELISYADAPAGSGLGTSSTVVTAILGAFTLWLGLPFGEYDLAHLAFEIERIDLGISGGKQDQYAATFGGFNFMEFYSDDKVIVNPLRIKDEYINELNFNIVLFYTGTSRLSSKIIDAQSKNASDGKSETIEAMHKLKEQAVRMKEAILKGELEKIGEILDFGWKYKKQTAKEVSNPVIDEIYDIARRAGSTGGKISGAGGGGFIFFYCPENTRYNVIKALEEYGGEFRRFNFTECGLKTWQTHY